MSTGFDDKKRRPLPRWRYAALAVPSHEHAGTSPILHKPTRTDLEAADFLFEVEKSPECAIELMNAALHHRSQRELAKATAYLRKMDNRLPAAVLDILESDRDRTEDVASTLSMQAKPAVDPGDLVRQSRQRLRRDPRNAVLYLDQARAYTVQGQFSSAESAIRRAMLLAPDHRVVLRRLARWLVHADRADEAWEVIRRHPRTQNDPWLMATEISLAGILDRSPTSVRRAREFLANSGCHPSISTELCSAIGTMELAAGDGRRGRRFVRDSLVNPNDNAIAQAQWLAKFDRAIDVDSQLIGSPSASEARFLRACQDQQWQDALRAAKEWQDDEPFSSRPAINGSFLASYFTLDYLEPIRIAKIGLRADPDDQGLRNNLVVSLILSGPSNFSEAQREFKKILASPSGLRGPVLLATHGLVCFSEGDRKRGRALYEASLKEASGQLRKRVAISWFNAESRFDPTGAEAHLSSFSPAWQRDTDPLTNMMAERILAAHAVRLKADGLLTMDRGWKAVSLGSDDSSRLVSVPKMLVPL